MRKVKYIFFLLVILFLSSCFYSNDPIEFEIQNNIEITISEYENYNWSKVIKIRYQGKLLNISDSIISLEKGEIKVGEVCEFKISYTHIFTTYKETFYVKIIHDKYKIKELFDLKTSTSISTEGTVSLVNEVGFILTDETGSIFVKYQNKENIVTKNNTVFIDGIYQNNNGHEILLDNLIVTTLKQEITVPITLTDIEFRILALSYKGENFPTKYITIDSTVLVKDNQLLLQTDNYYITLDNNALEEKTLLLSYEGQKTSLSGWIYKIDDNTNYLTIMIDKINFAYESDKVIGESPIIDITSNYYYFTSKDHVGNLTNYFKATDKEDGRITITNEMINGTLKEGQNIITLTVSDSDSNKSIASIIIEIGNYPGIQTNEKISIVDEYAMPSTGDLDVLVIPISFPNYPATNEMLDVIKKGFFGSETDTGWESLSTYYDKSSYGKLNINGDVTDWYTPKKSQSYYANYEDDDDYFYGSTILLEEALTYYKNKYDYSKYDSNNDGYIDAVYLIYNVSIGGNGTYAEEDFYWAFTYWDLYCDYRSYSKTKGYSYVFMSYDFFFDDLLYSSKKININCETLIHETGHLFNLEDYYDYDTNDRNKNNGGYCGADMMDYNIGDHGPYSKILLDWVDPVVISKSGIYELPSFTTTGTTFLIPANNSFTTIFDEYYLIDFYTLNGLNELEMKSYFKTTKNYAGVRISHVESSLLYEDGYFPTFNNNNTDSKYKVIKMLEADYKGRFDLSSSSNEGATLKDFYTVGNIFGNNYYSTYKSYQGNKLPFIMEVIAINDNYATIKITLN